MIFAVGRPADYDDLIKAKSPLAVKHGRVNGQRGGGLVFQTRYLAQSFLDRLHFGATHKVYGVKADWNADTYVAKGEEDRRYRRLKADARMVFLEDDE